MRNSPLYHRSFRRFKVRLYVWGFVVTSVAHIPHGVAIWYPVHIRWFPKVDRKLYGGHRARTQWPHIKIKLRYVYKPPNPMSKGYFR
jgi:hypothetical protein